MTLRSFGLNGIVFTITSSTCDLRGRAHRICDMWVQNLAKRFLLLEVEKTFFTLDVFLLHWKDGIKFCCPSRMMIKIFIHSDGELQNAAVWQLEYWHKGIKKKTSEMTGLHSILHRHCTSWLSRSCGA